MPLQIIRNDITQVAADAIVNTANPRPMVGDGTDRALHTAAGPELLAARQQIGDIPVGSSAATPAFALSAKYVLHTVSPVWIDGAHGEEELLLASYRAALDLAESLGCRSVAFPLLSAGTYAFPQDIALAVALRAFTDHLLEHDLQILLVLFNADAFGLAGSVFDDLKSYVDDNYVDQRLEEEYRHDRAWRRFLESRGAASFPDADREELEETARDLPNLSRLLRPDTTRRDDLGETAPDLPDLSRLLRPETARRDDFEEAAWDLPEDADAAAFGSAPAAPAAPPPAAPPPAAPAKIEQRDVSLKERLQSLQDLLRQHEPTFSEYLLDLLAERDVKSSEVYKRAEVSRQLFSKIISNRDYQPTKNTVLQLAIGLQLDLAQTQALLSRAGYALTRSSKTDLVVQYYIERGIYSVTFINAALDDCGLPLLKTGLKA